MKIVNVDISYFTPEDLERLKHAGEFTVYNDIPSEKEGIRRMEDADIAIISWFPVTKNVLASTPKLKYLTIAATGYDWVEIQEARKRNVPVSNAPNYSTDAVAEHTISLLLSASRFDSLAEKDLRSGKWNNTIYKGKGLKGKTLGIVGYGTIGKRVAEIAKNGFDMEIMFVNSSSSRGDFEQLLRSSDFISINAPLTDKTNGMLGGKEFSLMKDGVIIVNTGDGNIYSEEALIINLKSGKVFAAGLDVFAEEPIPKESPLLSFPNVVLTPHISYNTEEAQVALSKTTTENVLAFIKGAQQNVIN